MLLLKKALMIEVFVFTKVLKLSFPLAKDFLPITYYFLLLSRSILFIFGFGSLFRSFAAGTVDSLSSNFSFTHLTKSFCAPEF